MIVTCSECDTSFNFDEQFIKDTGSKVRCSKCKSVFLVYPPSTSNLASAPFSEGAAPTVTDGASGDLDSVDLSEIENLLDSGETPADSELFDTQSDTSEFELDLDLEDVGFSAEADPKTDLNETNELDLSGLDLEDANIGQQDDAPLEELDFELDLEPTADASAAGSDQSDHAPTPTAAEEGDFDLNMGATPADDEGEPTENLDLELDFSEADGADNDDMGAAQDFELSEIDSIAAGDEQPPPEMPAAGSDDDLDFGIEIEDESVQAADQAETHEGADAADEFDFELDFSEDGQSAPATVETIPGSDETEELDLSELEDMLETEASMPTESIDTEASDGLDFELELDSFEQDSETPAPIEPVMDETVALDVSDLEDLGQIEAESPAPQMDANESTDELDLELDLGVAPGADEESASDIEDSFDLADLDEMLGSQEDSVVNEEALESTDDFDLALGMQDGDAPAVEEVDAQSISDLEVTEESDLSDLEGMLDLDDKPIEAELASDVEELELDDISLESAADEPDALDRTSALQDVELAFDSEEPADEMPEDIKGLDTVDTESVQEEEEVADTFDMGTISADGRSKGSGAGSDLGDIPEDLKDMPPPSKRRISGPIRLLLVVVLIIGGGVGTLTLLDFLGLGINVKEFGANIPMVGDLFKPKYPDKGNLKIAIIEKQVGYEIVENEGGGPLLIIKGKVRNTYDHPRSFIRVTGKIYNRNKKLAGQKTVYVGNVIGSQDLTSLNTVAINKKLNNRFGIKRANVKVRRGRMVPFMIVFSKLPQDLDEFTVEVAGSAKSRG